jgi:hypothetical protein
VDPHLGWIEVIEVVEEVEVPPVRDEVVILWILLAALTQRTRTRDTECHGLPPALFLELELRPQPNRLLSRLRPMPK